MRALALLAFVAACRSEAAPEPAPPNPPDAAASPVQSSRPPPETAHSAAPSQSQSPPSRGEVCAAPFAHWDVAARTAALQGAWVMSIGGPRVPVVIDRDHLTLTDTERRTYDIAAIAPCAILLRHDGLVDPNLPSLSYAFRNGKLVLASGAIGERRGLEAVACAGGKVYVLDAAGACTQWTYGSSWTASPARCGFDRGGEGVEFRFAGASLRATGDVLHRPAEYPNIAIRRRDFESATSLVALDRADASGIRAARAAGGRSGDTTTIAGLIATVAADPAAWVGKQVTLRATFLGAEFSDRSALVWTHLIPHAEQILPLLVCTPREPAGLEPYDPVVVTGTIADDFAHTPALTGCVVSPAR